MSPKTLAQKLSLKLPYLEQMEDKDIPFISLTNPGPRRFFLELAPKNIPEVAKLLAADNSRMVTISALLSNKGYELLYHFNVAAGVLTLKTLIPKGQASMGSIADIVPAAELIEHEIMEFFGLDFPGNPRKTNFILPQDWGKEKKPLEKDSDELVKMIFPLAGRGARRDE